MLPEPPKTKGVGDPGAALKQKMRFSPFSFQEVDVKLLRNFKKKKIKAIINASMPGILRRAEGGNERREIPKKSAVTMPACSSDPDRSEHREVPSLTSNTSTAQIKQQLFLAAQTPARYLTQNCISADPHQAIKYEIYPQLSALELTTVAVKHHLTLEICCRREIRLQI